VLSTPPTGNSTFEKTSGVQDCHRMAGKRKMATFVSIVHGFRAKRSKRDFSFSFLERRKF
jgi:hypothetical protein